MMTENEIEKLATELLEDSRSEARAHSKLMFKANQKQVGICVSCEK